MPLVTKEEQEEQNQLKCNMYLVISTLEQPNALDDHLALEKEIIFHKKSSLVLVNIFIFDK